MQKFTLKELGISILRSGFWPQEAVIAAKEKIGKGDRLVVVEGNRLAAVKLLQRAIAGEKVPDQWKEIIADHSKREIDAFKKTLKDIPYILADSRQDVQSYLGFRHVTGIKQWEPRKRQSTFPT